MCSAAGARARAAGGARGPGPRAGASCRSVFRWCGSTSRGQSCGGAAGAGARRRRRGRERRPRRARDDGVDRGRARPELGERRRPGPGERLVQRGDHDLRRGLRRRRRHRRRRGAGAGAGAVGARPLRGPTRRRRSCRCAATGARPPSGGNQISGVVARASTRWVSP